MTDFVCKTKPVPAVTQFRDEIANWCARRAKENNDKAIGLACTKQESSRYYAMANAYAETTHFLLNLKIQE